MRLIGLAGLRREQRQRLAHSAVIWGVFVAAPFRRQGLGYRIIAHALEHANGMRGLCRVRLGVNATNVAAIKLYESPGFTPYGLKRGYMLIDGVLHDEMYMDRQMRFTPSLHP